MSRYTYAGDFKNPTEGYYVKEVRGKYEVWVREERAANGAAKADHKIAKAGRFDEYEQAAEYIESLHDFFEDDYSDYLDENSYEIAQMERYEAFRNEY